jgi:hypothetical protein
VAQSHQIDRRLTPRTKVNNKISISIGHTTPAFQDSIEMPEDAYRCVGELFDISDRGICITTHDPLSTHYFVDVYVSQDSHHDIKDRYSGVIIWGLHNKDQNHYRYGIEFLSSWIRRKIYRKYNKIHNRTR